ncbi:DUF2169 domain-containing protein [Sorangium sp. So ce1078]|uniref:DUF2169 domain-containing protein n=1 Tax=Sorangium sp. So ce1078 TaxID=3133329 RepID=UPI003F618B1D
MSPSTQHVAITPLGPSSVATVTWLLRGQLHVTVVVKATFALVPEGRMSLATPEPIAPDEQPDPSGRGLRTAGDLAPYRAQCDVVVTGHAELPPGFSSPEVMVRLTVVQGGQVRIDKQAQLDGSARVGAGRSHVRIDGMGPLSRSSPVRSRLLGGVDARRLAGLWLDIPERLDGSYFQAAPADQRLGALRGDEWIVLGGMIAQRPKLRTQLPDARGAARLYRRQRAAPRAGEPIALRADTVHVDVDRRCCSVVWRGHAAVEEAELASLRVLAGVELPAVPLPWRDPFASESLSSAREAARRLDLLERSGGDGNPLEGTALLANVNPLEETALVAGSNPLEETNPISPEAVAKLFASAVTPFEARRAPAVPSSSSAVATPPSAAPSRSTSAAPAQHGGGGNPLEGTNPIRPEDAARLLASPATPFEARRAPAEPARSAAPAVSPPAAASRTGAAAPASTGAAAPAQQDGGGNPLEGTNPIRPEDAARFLASPATPFEVRPAPDPPRAAPLPRTPPSSAPLGPRSSPWESSPCAPHEAHAAAQPIVASPGAVTPPVVPPSGLGDVGALPAGFGAQFLAAMADMDLPAG